MKTRRRIRMSYICFFSTIISTVAMSPAFGNFTPERLPGLVLVAIVLGGIWGVIAGSLLRIP